MRIKRPIIIDRKLIEDNNKVRRRFARSQIWFRSLKTYLRKRKHKKDWNEEYNKE